MHHLRFLSRFLIPAFLFLPALLAGSLQGRVRILEKDGQIREGLEDCVAILEPVDAPPPPLAQFPPVQIKTFEKRFVPRVTITHPGDEVAFPNMDHILHNVFSVTPGNAFDTGHYNFGVSAKTRVRKPGLVKVYCNVHHGMYAFLWVVETPWTAVLTGRKGVSFEGVPTGTYRLRLWHPEAGEQSWPISIGPGVTQGDWSLQISLPALEVHKNKFGKDYPPKTKPGDESGKSW